MAVDANATTEHAVAQTFNLDDLGSPRRLTIAGVDYRFQRVEFLAPADLLAWRRLSERLYALMAQVRLTREEEAEFSGLPDRIVRVLLMAPDAVHATLTDQQRMAIINRFIQGEA